MRAAQRLDDARARLAEVQSNRTKLASGIKKYEELVSQTENSPTDRKQVEDLLPQLKARFAALENEEQQRQTTEIEAEDELRTERAKLGELPVQLDHLEKLLEGSGSNRLPTRIKSGCDQVRPESARFTLFRSGE